MPAGFADISVSPIKGRFANLYAQLNADGKREMNRRAIPAIAQFVRDYILQVAPRNHKTANSFKPPAKPTGNLENAAKNTFYSFDDIGGTITVPGKGITRAFGPLQIRAKTKMLTIPARTAPEAYGRTASQVSTIERLFLVKSKSAGAFLATGDESYAAGPSRGRRPPLPKPNRPNRPHRKEPKVDNPKIRPVFWLRAAVTIPQKRNILPSDAALRRETKRAYLDAFDRLAEKTGTI